MSIFPTEHVQNWPEERKKETLEQIKRDPIFIAAHSKDPNVFFRAAGTEKVGDIDARIVDVNAAGAAIRWFVDPQTGHILKETYRTIGQSGPVQGETDLDDWKPVSGLNLPMLRHNKQNGQDSSTAQYTALEFNPSSRPKLFRKARRKALSPAVARSHLRRCTLPARRSQSLGDASVRYVQLPRRRSCELPGGSIIPVARSAFKMTGTAELARVCIPLDRLVGL